MFISDCVVLNGRDLVVETREVRGLRPLLAVVVDELFCSHRGRSCVEGFCLLEPPSWAWFVGIGPHANLGLAFWKAGQWALGYPLPLTDRRTISEDEAVNVWGWNSALLAESMSLLD